MPSALDIHNETCTSECVTNLRMSKGLLCLPEVYLRCIFPIPILLSFFFVGVPESLKIEIWELGKTTVCSHYPVFRLQMCISG